MDALDDVAALTERPQRRLGIFHESPLAHTDLVCKPKPFQLPHAPDLDCLQVIAFRITVGPQVDDADGSLQPPARAPGRAASNARPRSLPPVIA